MRAVLFLPAFVATVVALALATVFAVIPAVSTTDYLELEGGSSAGDLAILGDVQAGSLATGDRVAARFVDRLAQPYVVVGLQDGAVLLAAETENVVIVAPEAMVGRRVTDTLGGLGALYGFVDSAAGWGTVVAAPLGLWLLTLLGWRALGRRPERMFALAERALAPEPELAVGSEPVGVLEAAETPERVRLPVPAVREPIPFPSGTPRGAAAEERPAIDDLVLDLAREVARQAPQAGLRHVRRVTELSRRKQTLGWAGLAATTAAVAAATYLVASERTQKREKARRSPPRRRRWLWGSLGL